MIRDLNVFKIPIEDFTLENIDVCNEKHIKAIKGLRDLKARKMCFDVKYDVATMRKQRDVGNRYLVNHNDNYIGYVYISNKDKEKDERIISMIVQKKLRGKGYGKIILTGVTDYLLKNGMASSIKLYIKNKNIFSSRMALSSGFVKEENNISDTAIYSKGK